jgi:preprotein translocase subunit SecA
MGIVEKVLRAGEGKKLRRLHGLVPYVNELEPELQALADDALKHKTVEFRERLDRGEELDELLIESFAVVREAARRVIGQRHFDVQLMGGMALHFGWIAEMRTGEGKTLVSTLPVYLNALTGRGVHLVTVNDYLARFHAEWMGRIHRWLGLTVGLVVPEVDDPEVKRAAYACDVTYGTNTEFGFDYLRDNMARGREAMVQRGHVFAIVDEVDSILIDEARTPLIISGPAPQSAQLYYQFASIVRTLVAELDYEVDEEKRTVVPTEPGIEKVERQLGIGNLYDQVAANYVHQLQQALRAKELYKRDKDYIVADGEVKIVDEFTGRILEGRRWSDGLHQAVEAKERVRIKEENHTWATITLQNYFRMYEKLAGMTGTAETEASEFANTYNLSVVPIPTHRPMVREDHADLIYKTEDAKFNAVVEDLVQRYDSGQPVLVGTASVERSEHLSRLLDKQGIPHAVLNAKQHAREATIVVQAGRLHAITVATNMAGRGVDILLGGNPEGLAQQEAAAQGIDPTSEEGASRYADLLAKFEEECRTEGDEVRRLGGLYVLGSERHESRRIDNQLRGRAGRQGDPGESRFYLSLEDELMRLFATGAMNWVMTRALPEDVPIEARMVSKAIERAQATVESRNAEVRKDVLKYDEVNHEQRKVIYARRMQVLDGEDLRERTIEILEDTLDGLVRAACPNDYQEEWDLSGLLAEVALVYPTRFTPDELNEATDADQVYESLRAEAVAYYEEKEAGLPGGADTMRQLERDIMLQIIDLRWREHLAEMDYLREGINLRAMGQQDPLVAWQREGFQMFGQLMDAVDEDYLRYVMHAEVQIQQAPEPDLEALSYHGPDDPVHSPADAALEIPVLDRPTGDDGPAPDPEPERAAMPLPPGEPLPAAASPAAPVVTPPPPLPGGPGLTGRGPALSPPPPMPGGAGQAGRGLEGGLGQQPDGGQGGRPADGAGPGPARPAPAAAGGAGAGGQPKVGRNEPCSCGSGRKYKHCHGR